jgi:hypothetical protein
MTIAKIASQLILFLTNFLPAFFGMEYIDSIILVYLIATKTDIINHLAEIVYLVIIDRLEKIVLIAKKFVRLI